MTRPVSIVIPSLGDVPLLERALGALREEVRARGVEDQILVVDDTGHGGLRQALDVGWPEVRVHTRKQNGGFAAAALDGAQAADYRLMLLMHADVVVRPGTLGPLVEALQDEQVAAATPRIVAGGAEETAERATLVLEDGRLTRIERRTPAAGDEDEDPLVDVGFAPSCAMLVRREEFLAAGGFDPLFAPFGFEDVDYGIAALRRGKRIVEVPRAVVEHHTGGTIRGHVPDALLRASHERNRLLVQWKHLGSKREAHDHLVALWRDALDAGLTGRREELVHLALALGELEAVGAARARMADATLGLVDVV